MSETMPHGMYLNCLPKSASYFLLELFSRGLGLRYNEDVGGVFPFRTTRAGFFSELVRNRWLCRGHEFANTYHRHEINESLDRMVVHLRDIRAALFSFVKSFGRINQTVIRVHQPPSDYLERSEAWQIDWALEIFVPLYSDWICGWLDLSRTPSFTTKILFTTFEDFKTSSRNFVRNILEFYDCPYESFIWPDIKPTVGVLNYRSGSKDEWRTVFTAAQRRRANTLISPRLFDRFGWDP